MDVGNLISGSSGFSKSSLSIWKFLIHVLLKPSLKNFEHYFASVWNECNCVVVWAFFEITFLWDWNENWPFPVLWPLLSFPNLLAYWVQHFNRIRTLRNSGCEKLRILAQIAEMQMRRVISVSPDGSIFPYIKKCQIPKLGISDFLWKWKVKVVQLCPALCDPMYYTTHGILQARILECVAFPFSRGSSQPRDQTQVSCIAGRPLPAELPGKPKKVKVAQSCPTPWTIQVMEFSRPEYWSV